MAEVIQRVTGVRYHPGHVWRLLRELGWTRQRPARRAVERDEEAIARWIKQDWPRVKSARRRGGWLIFQDESGGLADACGAGHLGASGTDPVLRHKFNWKRMSMSAALCYRPDRSAAELVFATQPGAYNTETLIEFLGQLRDHLGDNARSPALGRTAQPSQPRHDPVPRRLPQLAAPSSSSPPTPPNSTRSKDWGQRQGHRTGQPLP